MSAIWQCAYGVYLVNASQQFLVAILLLLLLRQQVISVLTLWSRYVRVTPDIGLNNLAVSKVSQSVSIKGKKADKKRTKWLPTPKVWTEMSVLVCGGWIKVKATFAITITQKCVDLAGVFLYLDTNKT